MKGTRQFVMLWRNKFLTVDAHSIEDMIEIFECATEELKQMQAAGVMLRDDGTVSDDYAHFETSDPAVAERFDFDEEEEFEEEEDELEEEDFDEEEGYLDEEEEDLDEEEVDLPDD